MTETDIPPGGEGKIEVTFDSSHKKGKQAKTVTVESNDPTNPKATLHISLVIEVEFDFETPALSFGRVRKGESVSKTAVLLIKNLSKRNLLTLNSQSSHIAARIVESSGGDEGHVNVEITVKPGMPPGPLNETVFAELSDGSYPAAKLQIAGTVIGNVEANPETVHFTVDTSRTAADQTEQKVQVSGAQNGSAFRLLDVKDFKNLLAIDIDTLAAGERYVVRAKPNANALKLENNASGEIRILTDDSEQPSVLVRYSITIAR